MRIYKNYDDYCGAMLTKHNIKSDVFERNEKRNTFLNFVVPICIAIVCFEESIKHIIMIFAIGMILYDAISVFMDAVVFATNDFMFKLKVRRSRQKYNKISDKGILQTKLTSMKSTLSNMLLDTYDKKLLNEKINACNNALNRLLDKEKKSLEKERKEKEEESVYADGNTVTKQHMKTIGDASAYIEKLKDNISICPESLQDKYVKVLNAGEKLIERVKEKPYMADRINKTFSVYFPELNSLMYAYNDAMKYDSKEMRKKKEDTISEILKCMKEYVDDKRVSMDEDSEMRFQVSSSVLMEELQKETRKEKGGRKDV